MGKLIGSGHSNNFGENYFISKAKEYFDDETIIYWNRQVYGREFDVCILMPGKGILIVELKGWREEHILRVENNDTVVIQTEEGEISSSPQKQARGYRFSLSRYINQSIDKSPLVFQMVCLPQVSKEFFHSHRLDVVMEERFTILKEDLASKVLFFKKLDQALREVSHWKRDPFDKRTMLEVRSLFETDIAVHQQPESEIKSILQETFHPNDYSRFYYFNSRDQLSSDELQEMISQFLKGCKLYCVFAQASQMFSVVQTIDAALTQRGLVRNRDNIEIDYNDEKNHNPQVTAECRSFRTFHCSMSVLNSPLEQDIPSFVIKNGKYDTMQKQLLIQFGDTSEFNAEQYFIEHTAPDKNIIVRAGAGTGKTYTMISRIGFVCYSQNVPLNKMAERIVMITFTNEAADQMAEKLKNYFRNCYLITSKVEYLSMISSIESMQISTIHSFAKKLITRFGSSLGYGVEVGVTSSEFHRRKIVNDVLDNHIRDKKSKYGSNYTESLGRPMYAIREDIIDFIRKLHNKSVDVTSLEAGDFGSLPADDPHRTLHELLVEVIPEVERNYELDLLKNNRIHLSYMMDLINRFINDSESRSRIQELKIDKGIQFMFVDEFQDTDDTQIAFLLTMAQLLDYRLFLVGDVKQCIYRFRGAEEKAFDQLNIDKDPDAWIEFSLRRNYRTDTTLLNLFDRSFSRWGAEKLLAYDPQNDRLIGTMNYNGYISQNERFFKKILIAEENQRIPALVNEIKRIQRRIAYEKEMLHMNLTPKECSIAVLVRENRQAELIRTECMQYGIIIQTNTGGDLYMSQPALDMMTLVNALVHFDEAEYLYNLVTSNFFKINIPRSNLFEIRKEIRNGSWRSQVDEREQVNYLIRLMNLMLANTEDRDNTWEYLVKSLRTKPVLQVLRKIYSTLEPWRNFNSDLVKQHYYQLNVDLLFEQLINACNIDKLTINTLREYLYHCIVSKVSVDSRTPISNQEDVPIQCITVHKSKGLEYGHVILPFCSASIEDIKDEKLHVSVTKNGERYHIGYSIDGKIQNNYYDKNIEISEMIREETRILYVAMTRAIRSFSWIEMPVNHTKYTWQKLIETEV